MTRGRRETAAPAAYASARVRRGELDAARSDHAGHPHRGGRSGRGGRRRRHEVTITDAAPSLSEDVAGRMRRYWLLMGLRVVFLLLLFVVPRHWWWLCILGALVAPLLAVLVANSGREGGDRSAARDGTDIVLRSPDVDDGQSSPAADVPGHTFHVRPGEYLR